MRRSLSISVIATIIISAAALAASLAAGWAPKLGLDLAGGISIVYAPAHPTTTGKLHEAVDIIRNRANALGVSGANVTTQGSDVVVQMPGVSDPEQVIHTIGETAQLLFRPVLCAAPPYSPPPKGAATKASSKPLPTSCPAANAYTAANLNVNTATGNYSPPPPDQALASYPTTKPSQDVKNKPVLLPVPGSGTGGERYLLGPAQLTGTAIASATPQINPSTGTWFVAFTLTSKGSPEWDKMAKANFHQLVAADLDGKITSAPIIQATQSSFSSFGGRGEITGNFTHATASNLALVLNYGALPVQLNRLSTETVSPTLGKSSLKAGLIAGLVGLALVMAYTIFYYRGLGVVVVLGLATTAALLWVIISLLGRVEGLTLDLSGVTGLIVSVGITVDSYVVYFERLKDEVRAGRSVRSSVDKGFKRAYRTIIAADAVSFLGALILWLLSIGAVRGFAFFLGLSTLLDVATAYFFTRPLVIILGRSELFTKARWIGVGRGLVADTGGIA
ncbi:MAG: protein translocase subunit SecD [Actinobacteria bacterium]|jgi:preprotein translocase subunit SecD|nr:protein translocase subunit SecD [Actinomycetota bacterium]MCL6095929.1 protein translocase subunit SecD [Actinomycetota bacterium]